MNSYHTISPLCFKSFHYSTRHAVKHKVASGTSKWDIWVFKIIGYWLLVIIVRLLSSQVNPIWFPLDFQILIYFVQKQPFSLHMLAKIGFLKSFTISSGKHLCWSLFLRNFIKKRLQQRCFPVNIVKFLRTAFFRTIQVSSPVCRQTSISELVFHL